MNARPSITILVHERQPFERSLIYILNFFWKRWEERGHTVRVAHGVREWVPGDIVFNHVDLTVLPEAYQAYMARYPVAINGKVTDISKDRYSPIQLQQGDAWHGHVIVKTKANYGGHSDLAIRAEGTEVAYGDYIDERPWRKREVLDPYNYPVFESIAEVPPGVWRNPRLIVERFMAEFNEKGHYVMRNWHFFGDQSFVRKVSSPYHIVKPMTHGDDRGRECYLERTDNSVPAELETLREKMGFDYGRFDYVEVDGKGIVFDANTTPVIADEGLKMFAPELEAMVACIDQFA